MSTFKYQCSRCKQSFPKKYNLDKHLKKKNPCVSDSLDLPSPIKDNERPNLDDLLMASELSSDLGSDESCIICIYCGLRLKHKKNLKRHFEICLKHPSNSSIVPSLETGSEGSDGHLLEEINKLKTEFRQQI